VQVEPGREIAVRCSPADWIMVTGKGPASVTVSGHGLTDVALDISHFRSPYARVTVRDALGNRAWSNAFWFE
jgi:hypothetical protein